MNQEPTIRWVGCRVPYHRHPLEFPRPSWTLLFRKRPRSNGTQVKYWFPLQTTDSQGRRRSPLHATQDTATEGRRGPLNGAGPGWRPEGGGEVSGHRLGAGSGNNQLPKCSVMLGAFLCHHSDQSKPHLLHSTHICWPKSLGSQCPIVSLIRGTSWCPSRSNEMLYSLLPTSLRAAERPSD